MAKGQPQTAWLVNQVSVLTGANDPKKEEVDSLGTSLYPAPSELQDSFPYAMQSIWLCAPPQPQRQGFCLGWHLDAGSPVITMDAFISISTLSLMMEGQNRAPCNTEREKLRPTKTE